jgi:hypothetical protein
MRSSPDDPAHTRSDTPNLVSGTLRIATVCLAPAGVWQARAAVEDRLVLVLDIEVHGWKLAASSTISRTP